MLLRVGVERWENSVEIAKMHKTIRQYIESDYKRVCEIYNSSKLDELRFEPETFELVPFESDSSRRNKILEARIYLYCKEGVAGFIAVFESEIRGLFVCPNHRGVGIGQALLCWALTQISGDVRLCVANSNRPAIELYEKHGFEKSTTFMTEYDSKMVRACEMVHRRK